MREHDKILFIRGSALLNSFLLMSLFRESIWYVGGCSALYFGSSCFVADCAVTLLLYTEAGTRTNCSISGQMINDRRWCDCNSCNHFSDDRQFLLCFQVVFWAIVAKLRLETLPRDVFLWLASFLLSRFTKHSHRNRINSFGQDWRKWLLHLRESNWNTWRVERFYVFIVQSP